MLQFYPLRRYLAYECGSQNPRTIVGHNIFVVLQQLHRNPCAGFGIGEGVVVMLQMIAAGRCYGMQLVVGQIMTEVPARGYAGATELIIRIIHLIQLKNRFQAAFVKHNAGAAFGAVWTP